MAGLISKMCCLMLPPAGDLQIYLSEWILISFQTYGGSYLQLLATLYDTVSSQSGTAPRKMVHFCARIFCHWSSPVVALSRQPDVHVWTGLAQAAWGHCKNLLLFSGIDGHFWKCGYTFAITGDGHKLNHQKNCNEICLFVVSKKRFMMTLLSQTSMKF